MDYEGVMQAFATGLSSQEACPRITKKRKRRSKLQTHSAFILRMWSNGRSPAFIKNILQTKYEIYCNRSTVQRFITNSISL
jgi:hypothetical protein